MVDHGSVYSKILYDVNGKILVDSQNHLLNVYRYEMADAIESGELRIVRNSTMANVCYRYFVTSQDQQDIFINERSFGTTDGPNKAFHVYVDDDTDKTSSAYITQFYLLKE